MTTHEEEFKSQLDVLGGNARLSSIFLYTQLAFDLTAGSNYAVHDRVNEHAGFWNGILGGLQASGFIALGRVFDTRTDTNNAGRLLRYADEHPGIFSEPALAARKVAEGQDATFAAQYAKEAHHFAKGDLKPLRKALNKYRAYYDSAVKPIRHNVYAHAGRTTREERDAMFSGLPIRKLEKLAVFPLRLHDALWNLYMNGIKPVMRKAPTNVVKIADAGLGQNIRTWEHLHTVCDTVAFLEAFRLDPATEELLAARLPKDLTP